VSSLVDSPPLPPPSSWVQSLSFHYRLPTVRTRSVRILITALPFSQIFSNEMTSSAASSSPSPSPPPFSPFSHLPFELVEAIIEATLTICHDNRKYRNRQDTLLSLCLVSRLFHEISSPLLSAVIRIDEVNGLSWLSHHEEEEEVDDLFKIRELIVYYAGDNVGFDDLRSIFRTQRHITKLVLIDLHGEVDFATLSQISRKQSCLPSAIRLE